MLDIVDIVFDASFEGSIPTPAVDLCPAGHARFDFVPEHVFGNRFSELVDKRRTLGTRPDEAHLAAQNIDQLWQLIQARPPQPLSQPGYARIVAGRPHRAGRLFRIVNHCAKLEHLESVAVQPHALLSIEYRARRG